MSKIKPYLPPDAKINFTEKSMSEPEVEYEKTKQAFNLEEVKELTKGQYGKRD